MIARDLKKKTHLRGNQLINNRGRIRSLTFGATATDKKVWASLTQKYRIIISWFVTRLRGRLKYTNQVRGVFFLDHLTEFLPFRWIHCHLFVLFLFSCNIRWDPATQYLISLLIMDEFVFRLVFLFSILFFSLTAQNQDNILLEL